MTLLLLAVFLLAGCATPGWRIKRNPDVFNTFPPDVQEKVRQGLVEVGYTRDMVFIALGKPRYVYDRVTSDARSETWAYTGMRYARRFVPVDASYWYYDRDGQVRIAHGWSFVDLGYHSEFESLRVEFADDKVNAIESLRR